MSYRVAIVEDDEMLRENYSDLFSKQGYQVSSFKDRPSAQQVFSSQLPDLVIVDIGLGDEVDGGYSLCQWLRQKSRTLPIIFLSARDSDLDIVSGLRMGADGYVTKDMSLPHLVARVSALFRRVEVMAEPDASQKKAIELGKRRVDELRFSCHWDGQIVELTLTEFWMVYSLTKHPGHVKNRQQLMDESHIVVDDATITSHIKRIRKKFQKLDSSFACIDTVYGMGYRWSD